MILVLISFAARGDDWPMWRRDRVRSAVTEEKLGLPLQQMWAFRSRQSKVAPEGGNPQQEQYPWMTWYSLPISAAGDSIFFNSAADGRTVCLDAVTGKIRWEFVAGAGMNRTPTVWRGKVYVGGDDGNVYCLEAGTGAVRWQFSAAPADRMFLAYGRMISVWPVRTDVVVDDGIACFCAGVFPHDGTFLYAVNAEGGQLLWMNGTQCENGWRVSMAPAGHLYVSQKTIWVSRDCWGYFLNWGTLLTFERDNGSYPSKIEPSSDPDYSLVSSIFWPLMGVRKGNVRYLGARAETITDPAKNTVSPLWNTEAPGLWTDLDSVLSQAAHKSSRWFRYDPDACTVVYAGGVIFHSAFELEPAKGTGSVICARDARDGKELWSVEIPERANQLMVANGRLFASSRQGTIYCFAPGGQTSGVIEEQLILEPAPPGLQHQVKSILEQSAIKAGYALALDCQTGELALELARQSDLQVISVFADPVSAGRARKMYTRANLHTSRLVAVTAELSGDLPFPSCFSDLVVSESAALGGPLPRNCKAIERVQKPARGVALIGGQQDIESLKQWTSASNLRGWNLTAQNWAKMVEAGRRCWHAACP